MRALILLLARSSAIRWSQLKYLQGLKLRSTELDLLNRQIDDLLLGNNSFIGAYLAQRFDCFYDRTATRKEGRPIYLYILF